MAKTFDPNRVLPGTIELVRAADGSYSTKVVGLESINSLSLPEISTIDTAKKLPIEGGSLIELKKDAESALKDQTQMAFKMPERDGGGGIDTTGDMLKQATTLSRNLSDFSPDTASEQFARQAILPGTFDAEKFDETEDKVSIKDPTEKVFGKSTQDVDYVDAIRRGEVGTKFVEKPKIGDNLFKFEPKGVETARGRKAVEFTDAATRAAMTTDKAMRGDAMTQEGTAFARPDRGTIDQMAADSLGITSDPTKSTFGTTVDKEQGFTDIDRFKGISREGALAGKGEKQDVKPVKRNALETISTSLRTTKDSILSNIKTPAMALVEAIAGPESNIQKLNKSYFNVRDDGRIAGNPSTDLYAGFNRTSAFGNLEEAGKKRISTREKTIARKGYGPGDKFYDDTQKMKEQQKDYKKKKAETQKATQGPAGQGGASGTDSGRSKIVCTMMNESYGFGSFRNKIWMKFHGNIAPEYQKGYHKLFLPLVNYAKQKGITNKIIKNILEHIAVHSTIDMRQTLRGKRHTLGRLYRKVILPLCYWAGKK